MCIGSLGSVGNVYRRGIVLSRAGVDADLCAAAVAIEAIIDAVPEAAVNIASVAAFTLVVVTYIHAAIVDIIA